VKGGVDPGSKSRNNKIVLNNSPIGVVIILVAIVFTILRETTSGEISEAVNRVRG
jgi:hypothetical protein